MSEVKVDLQVRGTRILAADSARLRRCILQSCIKAAESFGCEEIVLPAIEPAQVYADKAGVEILKQMFVFPDRKARMLCLRPEGTATCQLLAAGPWRQKRDVKLWYESRCWRYERPQAGRYREFTQFGIEILNPTKDYVDRLLRLQSRSSAALLLIMLSTSLPSVGLLTTSATALKFLVRRLARRSKSAGAAYTLRVPASLLGSIG